MSLPYYRLSDANLLIWSNDFSTKLTARFSNFGITQQQAADYAAANTQFDTALTVWRNNASRTPVASANKQAAREALLEMARFLVNSINSNPKTTEAQREDLGIKGRKKPSPIPAPSSSPIISVVSVNGRIVTFDLHSSEGSRRGKPVGVKGANLFSYVGDVAPTSPSMWKFEGLITKTRFVLNFNQATQSNTAWVTVSWFNERGETGIASAPVSINLPEATQLPREKGLRIAG